MHDTYGLIKLDDIETQGPASALMLVVCCICHKKVRYKNGEGTIGTSHTFCDKCLKEIRNKE